MSEKSPSVNMGFWRVRKRNSAYYLRHVCLHELIQETLKGFLWNAILGRGWA
jgi:hypothetical protein